MTTIPASGKTGSGSSATPPDFAYPETVTKNAEKALEAALRSGDGTAAIRALANIGLAQAAIGNEKLPPVVKRIEQIRDKETDAVSRSLLSLLLADIYSDIYTDDKFNYDRRELPLTPLPDDYTEWSGAQFRNRIDALCTDALSASEQLKREPIASYSSIISAGRLTQVLYPTLYDFAASFTIRLRRQLTPFSNMFSLIYLSPRALFEETAVMVPSSPAASAVLRTYADWLKFHEGDAAPTINIDIMRINDVCAGLYNGLDDKGFERKEQLLRELYGQFRDSEYSGLALIELGDMNDFRTDVNAAKATELNDMIERNLKAFPAFALNNCLNNRLMELNAWNCRFSVPNAVAPGHDFKVKVSAVNTPRLIIDFYRLGSISRTDNYYRLGTSTETLVKSITVDMPGTKPYASDTTVVTSLPDMGCYIARPRNAHGVSTRDTHFQVIRSSLLSVGSLEANGEGFIVAVDPVTGAAVSDADILTKPSDYSKRNAAFKSAGPTDRDGFYGFDIDASAYFAADKGADRYSAPVTIYTSSTRQTADTTVMALTDLSLYHPGDTVKWVAVLYRYTADSKNVVAGTPLTAKLFTSNGAEAGTDSGLRTDEFGRATGSFRIPTEGLTGYSHINFYLNGRAVGSVNFMVSDYKLPTFAPEVKAVDMNTPKEGDVTLRGLARTYSGVAVAGAAVKLDLSVAQPVWWMRTNSVQFYSAEATTAADGTYSIEIPAEVFASGPAPKGIYTARLTVTSTDGESHQTSREFTLGPTYTLRVGRIESIDLSKPVRLNISAIDGEGQPASVRVLWTLKPAAGGDALSGSFLSSDPSVDWMGVPSGTYRASFLVEGTDSAYATVVDPLVLYRPDDRRSPAAGELLWSPVDNTTLTADGKRIAELLYASMHADQPVLLLLYSDTPRRIVERRWITAREGMNRLTVTLPADIEKARMMLTAISDFEASTLNFSISTAASERHLTLTAESFRDRIIPGAPESWTFCTATTMPGADSTAIRAAVMLNMYNAALRGVSDISLRPWELYPRLMYAPGFNEHQFQTGHRISEYLSGEIKLLKCDEISVPEWILYGRSFTSARFFRSRAFGSVDLMAAPMAMSENKMAMKSMAVTNDAAEAEDAVLEESAVDTTAGMADGGAQEADMAADVPFSFREGEVISAFFEPMLTTDADGRLVYTFTAPNANTTWAFEGLAFTTDLMTASTTRDVLANKPVMVQPNLPRFLRAGDRATVKATVMNNSDTEQTVATFVELFDPATGRIISRRDYSSTIAAGASDVVTAEVAAPTDSPFIGFRIKSSTEAYADGEQTLIPVLPFTTPVIETKPFYLPADTTSFSLQLPQMPADARVTLQYCDNPTWYVVTALPGLAEGDPTTSVEAASAIYSAAIADGLLRTNPAIADALRLWTASDRSDSTLVSMLERNADLKTVLLSATPWMMDARSDTERMERLALLFDRKQIEQTYAKAIACLGKLRCDDGGFAWGQFLRESSTWATYNLLYRLGELNRLGFMPADKTLRSYIQPALAYLQTETVKAWKKYPKGDYTDFVMLTDLWPDFRLSTSGQSIVASTVQRTLANWKNRDIQGKAIASLVLGRHGYRTQAGLVLKSLREYAVSSPTEGMYWPSVGDMAGGTMWQLGVSATVLDAFSLLDPQSPDIDRIRQWLILQKETRNWGSSATASKVIAAILGTSKTWVKPAGTFDITVGGQPVATGPVEKQLGYFRTDISSMNPSGRTLNISKQAASPAWGAVYCQYTAPITSVRAQSCDALSIEKRLLKLQGNEWIETDSIAVGDRVKVLLTIHAQRDLEYVAVTDDRAACLEPVEQLPKPIYSDGLCFYRENRDSSTRLFVTRMPRGTYQLSYELWVNNAGTFASGIATAQSQYAPQIKAHSAGNELTAH